MADQHDQPGLHPTWCSPQYCTASPDRPLGAWGGAHRSEPVPLGIEATVRAVTGPLAGQLQQALRPNAGVFLVWLINAEQVGQLRLEDAGPLALLIAAGLGALDEQQEN